MSKRVFSFRTLGHAAAMQLSQMNRASQETDSQAA